MKKKKIWTKQNFTQNFTQYTTHLTLFAPGRVKSTRPVFKKPQNIEK